MVENDNESMYPHGDYAVSDYEKRTFRVYLGVVQRIVLKVKYGRKDCRKPVPAENVDSTVRRS